FRDSRNARNLWYLCRRLLPRTRTGDLGPEHRESLLHLGEDELPIPDSVHQRYQHADPWRSKYESGPHIRSRHILQSWPAGPVWDEASLLTSGSLTRSPLAGAIDLPLFNGSVFRLSPRSLSRSALYKY